MVSQDVCLTCIHKLHSRTFLCSQEAKPPKPKRLVLGNSWFGSVKSAVEVASAGHHAVLVMNTEHSRFPNRVLQEKMKYFPGGTWTVMKGKCNRSGVELLAIGYKYNSKRFCFLFALSVQEVQQKVSRTG